MSSSVETLIADLHAPDETMRRFAAEDLGDCSEEAAVTPLVSALSDPSPAVREAALDALTRIGGEPVVRAVLPVLRSDHVPLRNAVCLLLKQLGETAVRHFCGLLTDTNRDVRLFAIDTLAGIGSCQAMAALMIALREADVNVAATVAAALGEIGSPAAVPALIAALDSDSWIRCAAAKSLGRIGGLDAVEALTCLAQDEDTLVVYAAKKALAGAGNLHDPQDGDTREGRWS